MNYRIEREHDNLLIELVGDLAAQGRLDILGTALRIDGDLGNLERAQCRRPFDVELTFTNLSVVIETKVDADEVGRKFNMEYTPDWQTIRIVEESENHGYLNENRVFRFITYGTSEFYTKPYERGPASPEFQHVGLEDMIALVEAADNVLPPCNNRQEWLRLMRIEQEKRSNVVELLQSFSKFRRQYLEIHGENDFPRNRLLFCAPELAFPVLGSLAQEWNKSEHKDRFGKVSIYPVGRGTPPVHDSILNFWEMWQENENQKFPTLGNEEGRFYLEINEDFNLNLKVPFKNKEGVIVVDNGTKERVWNYLDGAAWPEFVKNCRRDYKQTVVVLYEIDFGLLGNLNDMEQATENLADTLKVLIRALGDLCHYNRG